MPASTTNQWKLGLFVLAGFVTLVAIAVWLASRRFQTETITAFTYFDEPVTGLEVGSPVRFRGMTIGSVADIRVAPDRHHLEVACRIDVSKLEQIGLRDPGEVAREGPQIPPTLRAQIERSFVTGVAFLQTDFFDPERHPPPKLPFLVPDTVVYSVPSSQKNLQRALDQLIDSVPRLVEHSAAVVEAVQSDLEQLDLPAVTASLRGTLDQIRDAIAQVRWSELDRDTRDTLTELREALADVRRSVDELGAEGGLVARARDAIDRVEREITAADLPATTASIRGLVDGYAATAPEAADLMPALRRAADSFRRLADMLERDPSSLLRGRAAPADPRSGR